MAALGWNAIYSRLTVMISESGKIWLDKDKHEAKLFSLIFS